MNSKRSVNDLSFTNRLLAACAMLAALLALAGCGALSGSVNFLGSQAAHSNVITVKATTPNGVYRSGQTIQFHVTFPVSVGVTGTPTLELSTGGASSEASYVSGSGTNTLVFAYTIAPGDDVAVLDYRSTSSLKTQSGTITSLSGGELKLTLQAPASVGSISHSSTIAIDTIAPTAVSNFNDGLGNAGLTSAPTATWDHATDASAITYQIAIGTTAGDTDILPWTSKTSFNTATHTGLTLTNGDTYYTSVRAIDAAGNVGPEENGDGWVAFIPLAISPTTIELVQNERWPFSASGGIGAISLSLFSGPGTLTAGDFQGPNGAGTSIIRAQDTASNTADATITVRAFEHVSTSSRVGGPIMKIEDTVYDASGNLYAVGYYDRSGYQWLVMKYDGTTWTILDETDLGAGYGGVPKAILVNSATDIYVAGQIKSSALARKWIVRHFDGTTWTTSEEFELAVGASSTANSIARGTDGTIYVAGTALDSSTEYWVVRKFSGGIWSNSETYQRAGTSTINKANAVAVAPNGTVYVCGEARAGATGLIDWVVRKFDGVSWSEAEAYGVAPVNERCTSLAVDSSNNVYAAGEAGSSFNELRKWDGSSWSTLGSFTPAGYGNLRSRDLELDSSERPVLTYDGPYGTSNEYHWVVGRYDPAPTLLHTYGSGRAYELARQPGGDVVVAGQEMPDIGGVHWHFRKTNGTTLSFLTEYQMTKPTTMVVNDSAYDSTGNLYTVGYIDPYATALERLWIVRKYDGTTWTDVDVFSLNSFNTRSEAKEILIDASGSIYVVGEAFNQSGDRSWVVRKFDGTSWTTSDTVNSGLLDAATSIVSHAGSIYVAGWQVDSFGESHFVIRRFDGTSWSTFQTFEVVSSVGEGIAVDMIVDSSNQFWVATAFQAELGAKHYIEIYKFDGTTWTLSDSYTNSTQVLSLKIAQVSTGEILQAITHIEGGVQYGVLRGFAGASWVNWDAMGAGTSFSSLKADASGNVYVGGLDATGTVVKKVNPYFYDLVYLSSPAPGYLSEDITSFAFGPSGRMSFFGSGVFGADSRRDAAHYRLAP